MANSSSTDQNWKHFGRGGCGNALWLRLIEGCLVPEDDNSEDPTMSSKDWRAKEKRYKTGNSRQTELANHKQRNQHRRMSARSAKSTREAIQKKRSVWPNDHESEGFVIVHKMTSAVIEVGMRRRLSGLGEPKSRHIGAIMHLKKPRPVGRSMPRH